MDVILKQDIDRLGKAGSVVKVKDGYARNFLIPNGLAVSCTSGNLRKLQEDQQKKQAQMDKVKQEAEGLKGKLAELSLTIPVLVQEEDKIYGSIGPQEIVAALKDEGFEIDKNSITLNDPVKALGIYEATLKLHPEVIAKIKIWIVKK